MSLHRRQFLDLSLRGAAVLSGAKIAAAQAYPARPVRIVVGYAAGGSADICARLIAQSLSERFGQSFVMENRLGAGGNIATDTVLRAPADGYTLLLITTPNLVSPPLAADFDPARDTEPVGGVAQAYLVMLVHPSVPAKTVPEFITYAKANPGKLSMASAGNGTAPHMSGELFKMMAGVDMIHVPYRGGGPARTDLLSGQVQVMFSNLTDVEHIKTGKLRALAVTTAKRLPTLPDLPSMAEFVPGYEARTGFGVSAPKGTPAGIIDQLSKAIGTALANSGVRTRLNSLGASPLALSPAAFGKFLADETAKWAKVARAANIKAG